MRSSGIADLFGRWGVSGSSETLVHIYHITWRHTPEKRNLHFHSKLNSSVSYPNENYRIFHFTVAVKLVFNCMNRSTVQITAICDRQHGLQYVYSAQGEEM
jgi:hypothetical protein